jgi:hypothetical protein
MSAFVQITRITQTLTPTSVGAASTSEQTFTVVGLLVGDDVSVSPPAAASYLANARVSAANTLAIQFINPTAGTVTPIAGAYNITVFRI